MTAQSEGYIMENTDTYPQALTDGICANKKQWEISILIFDEHIVRTEEMDDLVPSKTTP